MVMMHVWFIGPRWHFGEIAGIINKVRLFSLFCRFSVESEFSGKVWRSILWHLWIGRARHPGPPSLPRHVGVEFLNVGGWLTHGDLALEVWLISGGCWHRLIPARVRGEWSRLRKKELASFGLLPPRIPPM